MQWKVVLCERPGHPFTTICIRLGADSGHPCLLHQVQRAEPGGGAWLGAWPRCGPVDSLTVGLATVGVCNAQEWGGGHWLRQLQT